MKSVFISYSHKDEDLRQQLEVQLAVLRRQGAIDVWNDRRIVPGQHIDKTIDANLDTADIVLLLVSPDFLGSEYCYDIELQRALERHEAGLCTVIPVILRPCDWQVSRLGRLAALPKDARPITKWPDRDEAFLDVVQGIRAALGESSVKPVPAAKKPPSAPSAPRATPAAPGPRSSNLRTTKHFSDADKDRFLEESFEYMANFFENSLKELEARNSGITTAFKRVSAQQFSAVAYRDGKAKSRCRIQFAGRDGFLGGITFAHGDASTSANSFNESLSIEVGPQEMHLKPLGMQMRAQHERLSQEGAAEYYWELFMEPLQQ